MIRKAVIQDAQSIYKLISVFAEQHLMLHRSLNSIYENIRDFWVVDNDEGNISGCAALHVIGWNNMAEIKSLSVKSEAHNTGLGKKLVNQCLEEAPSLGIKNVFALTFAPDFFLKCGFKNIEKETLPHKIWADCIDCPYFPDCKEIAVSKEI